LGYQGNNYYLSQLQVNRVTRHFPITIRGSVRLMVLTIAVFTICFSTLTVDRPAASPLSDTDTGQDTIQMDTAGATVLILLEEETFEIKNLREAYYDYRIKKRILRSVNQEEGIFTFPEGKNREILSIEAKAVYPDAGRKLSTGMIHNQYWISPISPCTATRGRGYSDFPDFSPGLRSTYEYDSGLKILSSGTRPSFRPVSPS